MQRKSRQSRTNKKSKVPRGMAFGSKANSTMVGYAPVAMSRAVPSGNAPNISSNGGCTRIQHTEYFTSVISDGVDYGSMSFACNPGIAAIFPWLSQIAQRFETYKFRELTFAYHTRAITTQVGTVGIVFDFDANDPAPLSQMEALAYRDKTADACWKDQKVRLDLANGDRQPTRYTRSGLLTGNFDLKTYDVGNLHIFTDGVAASNNLGLVSVSYVVDLYTAQVQLGVAGLETNTGTMGSNALFGTTHVTDAQGIFPYIHTGVSSIEFDQSFDGFGVYVILGTGLGVNFNPNVTNGGTGQNLGQQTNSALTQCIGFFTVRAVPGAIMTPTITAVTVTSVQYYWARGSPSQYTLL